MNEKFFDLSKEKQDRMINGALKVFARNGFKHASTDDMVKAVDVSKGLWFHYFVSKTGLYTFVFGYSVKYMLLELSTVVDNNEKNYFEIMKQIEFTKMRIGKTYPYMTMFLEKAMAETEADIVEATAEDRMILQDRIAGLLKNGEIPGVTEKAQRERIKKMVQYTIAGVVKDKFLESAAEPEAVYKEVRNYLDMIRSFTQQAVAVSESEEPETVFEPVAS